MKSIVIGLFIICSVYSWHVHIAPHTHNDLGWIYSMESYFKGNQRGCVDWILNNVTQILSQDSRLRFSYVEMGFFKWWWARQNETIRGVMRKLIANQQFDFMNAGISMNDEGACYYDDIIEQMTKGLTFLKNEFNYTVKSGWHIDPFGHTSSQANIFSQMGFNTWFFERIDYQDFWYRTAKGGQGLEMLWVPQTYTAENYIMAHVDFMSYYLAPFDWCIDIVCYQSSSLFDAVQKVVGYTSWLYNQTNFYISDHIFHQVGGDFEYSFGAQGTFDGLAFTMDFINAHPEYNISIFFSTPNNYSESVYASFPNQTRPLPLKTDDFMPYAIFEHAYWTGYFTSRASFKAQIREFGHKMQTLRKIYSRMILENITTANQVYKMIEGPLDNYEFYQGVLQHHDSVTGTAKQNVTFNYIDLKEAAIAQTFPIMYSYASNFSFQAYNENLTYQECNLNTTAQECPYVYGAIMTNKTAIATVYNPSNDFNLNIQVKVPRFNLQVLNESNVVIPSDVICDNLTNPNDCNLYFVAYVEPNAMRSFKISQTTAAQNLLKAQQINGYTVIPVSPSVHLNVHPDLINFQLVNNTVVIPFSLDYQYYQSYWNATDPSQPSGAYVFRPMQNYSLNYSGIVSGSYYLGTNIVEVHIIRKDVISFIKFYLNEPLPIIQIQTRTLPVNISDGIGKEVIMKVSTPVINNNNTFYTDSNGLEMMQRILNYRPSFQVNLSEIISGNYYPVYSAISIQDVNSKLKMTLMPDRSEAGSSIMNGELELMLQRRILHDDNFGVDQALNETNKDGIGIEVFMTHYLFFTYDQTNSIQRNLQYLLDNMPTVLLAKSNTPTFAKASNQISTTPLPDLIKFYIRPYGNNEYLVRVHNLDDMNNQTVPFIDTNNAPLILAHLIGNQYQDYIVSNTSELTLSANQLRETMLQTKYRWNGNNSEIVYDKSIIY